MNNEQEVRIGLVGAARIAPAAVIQPSRQIAGVTIQAVAARDPQRAEQFARKHNIPRVHNDYDELLRDPEIDAVYIALPPSHHHQWSIRAMEAGKHVLCEKPLASRADQAVQMVETSQRTGRILCEAMHYRFHPIASRMKEIVESGQLGAIRRVEAQLCVPILSRRDIRYNYNLAGGAMMDVGCYAVNVIRFLAGEEPEVTGARAKLASPDVDQHMVADFQFPNGFPGWIRCSIFSFRFWRASVVVTGERGELRVFNPYMPQLPYRFRVRDEQGRRTVKVTKEKTYHFQLQAFVDAVCGQAPLPVNSEDAVANMRVIDAVYKQAGLKARP